MKELYLCVGFFSYQSVIYVSIYSLKKGTHSRPTCSWINIAIYAQHLTCPGYTLPLTP